MTHQCRYDWLSSYRTTEKLDVDPISTDERQRRIFAIYGSTRRNFLTDFLVSTEFENGITVPEYRQHNAGNQAYIEPIQQECDARGISLRSF